MKHWKKTCFIEEKPLIILSTNGFPWSWNEHDMPPYNLYNFPQVDYWNFRIRILEFVRADRIKSTVCFLIYDERTRLCKRGRDDSTEISIEWECTIDKYDTPLRPGRDWGVLPSAARPAVPQP